tara:strand:+ start:4521 stop:4736 length:216 start_codon:yes stop_codon:yes gene_type:complete
MKSDLKILPPKKIGPEKYSIQIYDELFIYSEFNPEIRFTYWVGAEVTDFDSIPERMRSLELIEVKCAVFYS